MEAEEITRKLITKFTCENMPSVIAKKVSGLVDVLNEQNINMKKLKSFLAEGIPDQATTVREYCWKIILGYLPQQKSKWQQKVHKQLTTYNQFIQMFMPKSKYLDYPMQLNRNHPQWKQLEEQFYLWEQIQKDTSRTHAQLSFFCNPAPQILIPYLTSPRREKFRLIYGENQEDYKNFLSNKQLQRKTYKYDYMTRILYIYARLNPKIQYVQGMNEILAPIFYLVNAGRNSREPIDEAACFFMFNNAISDIIELHIKDLDKSQNGIHGKLNQVNEMLVVIEPIIWSQLQTLKIDPFFYCFRWMTLLFAQDFPLFDTLRIWQSIFSAENRLDFMNYFAIAIIISAKKFILKNDFVAILQYLQNISETISVNQTIKIANQLYCQFKNHDFKQHSQITKKALNEPKKQKKNWYNTIINKVNKMI